MLSHSVTVAELSVTLFYSFLENETTHKFLPGKPGIISFGISGTMWPLYSYYQKVKVAVLPGEYIEICTLDLVLSAANSTQNIWLVRGQI